MIEVPPETQTRALLGRFFGALPKAPARALMLDYDGTLAPFVSRRDEAWPYPGVRERLARLIALARTRVVIISGRPCNHLVPLLSLEDLPELWGSHGWEHWPCGADCPTVLLPSNVLEALGEASALTCRENWKEMFESKPVGIALHWRGCPERAHEVRSFAVRCWTPFAENAGLQIKPFDGGMELSVPGCDKGHAIRVMLDGMPAAGAAAFLGDDLTDEDGFRALSDRLPLPRRLGLLARPQWRPSAADGWIIPPAALFDFLDRWITIDQA